MTLGEWITVIVGCTLAVGFFVFLIVMSIQDDKLRKKEAAEEALHPKDPFPEPLEETFTAQVTDLACSVRMVGARSPKTVKEFLVTVTDTDGKIRQFPVPEAYYEGFEVGLRGTVTLRNGELYSFETE